MIKALKRNTAFLYSRVQKRFVKTFLDRRQLSLVEGFDADSSNLFCKMPQLKNKEQKIVVKVESSTNIRIYDAPRFVSVELGACRNFQLSNNN